jgi:hypothetical protein
MFDPPNPLPNPGSYVDLLKRMTRSIHQTQVDGRILELMQQTYERELAKLNVVLSRPERERLFRQVTKAVLTGILQKIGGTD